jgi:hypothetical protein
LISFNSVGNGLLRALAMECTAGESLTLCVCETEHGPLDHVQHGFETLANILSEESQNEIAVFLKQLVFATVPAIRIGVSRC